MPEPTALTSTLPPESTLHMMEPAPVAPAARPLPPVTKKLPLNVCTPPLAPTSQTNPTSARSIVAVPFSAPVPLASRQNPPTPFAVESEAMLRVKEKLPLPRAPAFALPDIAAHPSVVLLVQVPEPSAESADTAAKAGAALLARHTTAANAAANRIDFLTGSPTRANLKTYSPPPYLSIMPPQSQSRRGTRP